MSEAARRVLVIESDRGLREAIQRLLKEWGFASRGYSSAEDLLSGGDEAAAAGCILCDLRVPPRSGVDLLGEIRARGWRTPVIVMSSCSPESVGEACRRHGVVASLAKPFEGPELQHALETALRSEESHARAWPAEDPIP
jgi:FixJ family two-component response regulator